MIGYSGVEPLKATPSQNLSERAQSGAAHIIISCTNALQAEGVQSDRNTIDAVAHAMPAPNLRVAPGERSAWHWKCGHMTPRFAQDRIAELEMRVNSV
jgi:hypothetical protein